MGNKATPIFKQALNDDRKLFTEDRAHITADVYAIRHEKIRFDSRHGNLWDFANGQGK